ncbi:erythromycin esterase family protein [Streptomyces sp. NPDC088789]|uniref:erythromycin esterase family protein n=1 Tax=Streptomyces sp. NPDC088789 TaxID=3365899 RepID=UPI0038276CA1
MRLFPGPPPRVLALGEPTHGEDLLLAVRNDLFRQLIERAGYRTVAIESDCLAGLVVDDHITRGTGTLDDVMAGGFSHGLGASAANRALVAWLREFNEGRPAADRVRFAGIDAPTEITGAPSPRRSLMALHSFLAAGVGPDLLPCTADTLDRLLGDDDRWPEPAAMRDPSRSVGGTPEAGRLRLLADDLVALLEEQAPGLTATTGREEWDRVRLHGRTATGLLAYHRWMADPSPARISRLLSTRDRMMAGHLLALAERGPVLAFAHNAHLQRHRSEVRMDGVPCPWWGAGALAATRLGAAYGFVAMAVGTIRHHGVDTPAPDTLEGLLYGLPDDRCLLDAPRLADALAAATPAPRTSPYHGYAPYDPGRLTGTDGLVYVRDLPEG